MKKLLPLSAVAGNLGIKPETLRRKVRAGQIQAYKIGKVWRFPEESIDVFLNSCLKQEDALGADRAPGAGELRVERKDASSGFAFQGAARSRA